MNQPAQFCETTVAKTIRATIAMSRAIGANAALVGPPGIGKTFSLSHYASEVPHTYMLTASPLSGNAARHLFRQLGNMLDPYRSIHGTSLIDLERWLYEFDLRGYALIVDEAQNLNLQTIRHLLYLNDQAGMSLVFCGNDVVLNRTTVDTGPFAQVGSRVSYRRTLKAIQPADAEAITNTFGVEGLDAYALMRDAGERHHARGIVAVLQAARLLVGDGKTIKASHIRDVLNDLPQYRPAPAKH